VNLHIDSLGNVSINQAEPIRELHLHVHEGVSEEVLVSRLEQQAQTIMNRFTQMEENLANRMDTLQQKVEAMTAAATQLGTDSVNLANVVVSETSQVSAKIDELKALAADNPALDPIIESLDGSMAKITDAHASLVATATSVSGIIPDLPPVDPGTGGDTGTGGTTGGDTGTGGTEVPPDGGAGGGDVPPVTPGGDLSTPA
jgi:hypothetical protein